MFTGYVGTIYWSVHIVILNLCVPCTHSKSFFNVMCTQIKEICKKKKKVFERFKLMTENMHIYLSNLVEWE